MNKSCLPGSIQMSDILEHLVTLGSLLQVQCQPLTPPTPLPELTRPRQKEVRCAVHFIKGTGSNYQLN